MRPKNRGVDHFWSNLLATVVYLPLFLVRIKLHLRVSTTSNAIGMFIYVVHMLTARLLFGIFELKGRIPPDAMNHQKNDAINVAVIFT